MEPTNKIALITGGSRGLGKNMALHLANDGIDVIITYRNKKAEAEDVVRQIEAAGQKAACLQLDVADTKSFNGFFEQAGHVLQSKWSTGQFNFLVNNAGFGVHASIAQTTEEEFDNLFNTHFKGVFFLTQKALPLIADGGRIINLSTGLTRFSSPGYAAYASMKGAVEVFTKYLAKEAGVRGISANIVAPGIIETDFTEAALNIPGLRDMMNAQTALGRVGQPDDIGGVISFLCSENGRWVNGMRLEASGGMFL